MTAALALVSDIEAAKTSLAEAEALERKFAARLAAATLGQRSIHLFPQEYDSPRPGRAVRAHRIRLHRSVVALDACRRLGRGRASREEHRAAVAEWCGECREPRCMVEAINADRAARGARPRHNGTGGAPRLTAGTLTCSPAPFRGRVRDRRSTQLMRARPPLSF